MTVCLLRETLKRKCLEVISCYKRLRITAVLLLWHVHILAVIDCRHYSVFKKGFRGNLFTGTESLVFSLTPTSFGAGAWTVCMLQSLQCELHPLFFYRLPLHALSGNVLAQIKLDDMSGIPSAAVVHWWHHWISFWFGPYPTWHDWGGGVHDQGGSSEAINMLLFLNWSCCRRASATYSLLSYIYIQLSVLAGCTNWNLTSLHDHPK